MVANFAKYKRHQALFAVLRSMPKEFRIHLHGQDQDGRGIKTIREMASGMALLIGSRRLAACRIPR